MKRNQILLILFSFLGFIFALNFLLAQTQNQNLFKNIFDFLFKSRTTATSLISNNVQSKSFLSPLQSQPSIIFLEDAVTTIAEQASQSVVSIVISKYVPIIEQYYVNPFGNPFEEFNLPPELKPFFEFRFEVPRYRQKGYEKQKIGGGTGFIISSDGLILTNKHVVNDQNAEYTVYLNDGRKFQAKVLLTHPVDDLALVKIDANGLKPLSLGDSDKVKLGQFVVAIGNALGEFQNTVSFGVVSGLKRSITASDERGNVERLENLIQTDAAINFGNSGGPLINLKREVIGVNTAIVGGAENIGFAIPINRAKKMLQDYRTKGKIEVPFLGVYYLLINDEIQKRFSLPVNYGAYIYRENGSAIISNSPAELYGLKDKDIILEVDNEKVTPQNSLVNIIQKKNVGHKISLKVLKGNKILNLYVILGKLPENLQ